MKTSEKLQSDAKAFAGQSSSSSASHVLASTEDNEVNTVSTYNKKDKKRKQPSATQKDIEFPPTVYKYYVRKLKLSMKEVPRWLHCHLKQHKDKVCVTNKKDPAFDPKCDFILQDGTGKQVDEYGVPCAKQLKWLEYKDRPYVSKSSSSDTSS